MLKSILGYRLLAQLSPDANTGGGSSIPSDDNVQESSPAEQAVEQAVEETSEVAKTESEESATEETGEETSEQKTTEEDDGPVEVQKEETVAEPPVIDKPEDEQLPFNRHPRFKELVEEKNTWRQQVESVKPLVDQARATNEFLAQHQIQPKEYQAALQYLQLLRTDPIGAFKMLQPTYEQLALMAGERLTPELQAEVATGVISAERAAQIVKAEAKARYDEWRQSQGQQVQQQSAQQAVATTIGSWETTKRGSDPDFKPGSPLYVLTDKNIRALPTFQTAADAQAGCEKAYAEARAFLAGMQPKPQVVSKRPPTSRPNNPQNGVVIKTAEDVMKAIRAGVKPAQMKYS